jgi:hypothetical protein
MTRLGQLRYAESTYEGPSLIAVRRLHFQVSEWDPLEGPRNIVLYLLGCIWEVIVVDCNSSQSIRVLSRLLGMCPKRMTRGNAVLVFVLFFNPRKISTIGFKERTNKDGPGRKEKMKRKVTIQG